jgi:stress response protein SCP2
MVGSQTFDCSGAANRAVVSGDLVMGLRWDLHEASSGQPARRANLDAACALLDIRNQLVELVHPGNMHSRNGSVLHTGDSTTGTSAWDDERIFVFLDALPEDVATLAFVVRTETGRVFGDVKAASWHLSDVTTEYVYRQADLQPYGYAAVRCVATVCRRPGGWHILDRTEAGAVAVAAESLMLGLEDRA